MGRGHLPHKTAKARSEYQRKYRSTLRPTYAQDHYRKNKEAYLANNRKHRQKRIAAFAALKASLSCNDCGEADPACLDFHHVDPSKKEGMISVLFVQGYALGRVKKELEKCVVLCANCHRKVHAYG